MSQPTVTLDWLDALLILRRTAELKDVRGLVEHTELHYRKREHRLIETSWVAGTLHIDIDPAVEALPKIERVEVMLYTACVVLWLGRYPGNPAYEAPREAFQNLCRRAGCWHTNTPDIRERWRLIDFETPAHLLPSACFEDRPACKLCGQPVATGAGSTQVGMDLGLGMKISETYRPDLHEECDRYIHRVMLPKLRAQVEAEKLTAAGDVDK